MDIIETFINIIDEGIEKDLINNDSFSIVIENFCAYFTYDDLIKIRDEYLSYMGHYGYDSESDDETDKFINYGEVSLFIDKFVELRIILINDNKEG